MKISEASTLQGQKLQIKLPALEKLFLEVYDDQTFEAARLDINVKVIPNQNFQFYMDQLDTEPAFFQMALQIALSLDHFDSKVSGVGAQA